MCNFPNVGVVLYWMAFEATIHQLGMGCLALILMLDVPGELLSIEIIPTSSNNNIYWSVLRYTLFYTPRVIWSLETL
jgi:hypothetical protein